jgi:curved DNA-binding protein CbpA
MINYYNQIGVETDALSDRIEAAYFEKLLELRLDPNNEEKERKVQSLYVAYKTLCNPVSRKDYDELLWMISRIRPPHQAGLETVYDWDTAEIDCVHARIREGRLYAEIRVVIPIPDRIQTVNLSYPVRLDDEGKAMALSTVADRNAPLTDHEKEILDFRIQDAIKKRDLNARAQELYEEYMASPETMEGLFKQQHTEIVAHEAFSGLPGWLRRRMDILNQYGPANARAEEQREVKDLCERFVTDPKAMEPQFKQEYKEMNGRGVLNNFPVELCDRLSHLNQCIPYEIELAQNGVKQLCLNYETDPTMGKAVFDLQFKMQKKAGFLHRIPAALFEQVENLYQNDRPPFSQEEIEQYRVRVAREASLRRPPRRT